MDPELISRLSDAPTLFGLLLITGIILPFPEDVIMMTAGVLVGRGELSWVEALAACSAGLTGRNLLSYAISLRFGRWLLSLPRVVRFVGPDRLARWFLRFERRAASASFIAAWLSGARVKLILVAGAMAVPARTFVLWNTLGSLMVAPVMVTLGYVFGEPLIEAFEEAFRAGGVVLTVVAVVAVVGWLAWRRWGRRTPVSATPPS